MSNRKPGQEIKVMGELPELPEIHCLEAERRAKEADLMTLLQQAGIGYMRYILKTGKFDNTQFWRTSLV